jgi:hypothetical protein
LRRGTEEDTRIRNLENLMHPAQLIWQRTVTEQR